MTDKPTAVATTVNQTPAAADNTPMQMLQQAVASDVSMEKLEKLMDLQERWEKNEAKKAFNRAMAGFRSESIKIVKSRQVAYETQAGVTSYKHAELGNIIEAVVPALSKHGLSHHWETEQKDARIYVTCILTHEQGHSESVSLNASPDDSGKKNAIQSIGSTITYLQRYTFLAITGLAAQGQDDDGAGAAAADTLIEEDQIATLAKLIEETGADRAVFLEWLGNYPSLEDIRASDYERALVQLRRKKAKQEADADGDS